jgi:hypothetical protein
MALAWWLVTCLPFPGLLHIYFLFTVRLRFVHVCHNKYFCNRYLSFLLEEMILYLICGFWMMNCTMSPLSRFTAHLLPVYRVT